MQMQTSAQFLSAGLTRPKGRTSDARNLLLVLAGLLISVYPAVTTPFPAGAFTALAFMILLFSAWHDIRYYLIPNAVTYPGLLILLCAAVVMPEASASGALLGTAASGGALLLLRFITRGGIGLGDVKLAAFGGALVGVENVLPALLIGSFAALIPCLVLVGLGKLTWRQSVPFGPALSLGFLVASLVSGTALRP